MKVNDQRVRRQKIAQEIAVVQARDKQQSGYVWVWSKDFHVGIIGLVATNLAQKLGVPTFIGAINEKESRVVGSGRMPKESSSSLLDAFEYAKETLVRFGGHRSGGGL